MMPQPKPTPKEPVDNFYESLPATAEHFFQADAPAEYDSNIRRPGSDEIKITALITIAFVILAAVGLALLLFGALDVLRSTLPS